MSIKRLYGQQRVVSAHPLAIGLTGAWLMNEMAGVSYRSVVNPHDVVPVTVGIDCGWNNPAFLSTNHNMLPSKHGMNQYLASANTYGSLSTPSAALQSGNAISIMWRGYLSTSLPGGNNPFIAGLSYTSSNSSPYVAAAITRDSSSSSHLWWVDDAGGTNHTQDPGTAFLTSTPTLFTLVLTFQNGGNCVGYVNGAQVCSASRSGALSFSSPYLFIGSDFSNESGYLLHDCVYFWNRVLTATEVRSLYNDPYQFLSKPWKATRRPLSGQTISPSGLASAFAAGTPDLEYTQDIAPGGLASAFAAGTPIIENNNIGPTGLPSAFAVGVPTVSLGTITPTGLPSAFAAGAPTLNIYQNIAPSGKPSDFAAGKPNLLPAQNILPTGLASAFAAGSPTVQGGPLALRASGLASGFRPGFPTIQGPTGGLRIWIGGYEFTQYLMNEGLSNPDADATTSPQPVQLTSQTIGRWTALFDLYDVEMEAAPIIDATCLIQENGVTIFSGGIQAVTVDRFTMGQAYQSYHVTALDWSSICDRRVINATYLAGYDVSSVFQSIWANILCDPNEGITATGIAPVGTDTLDNNEVFPFITVTQAFDQICTDQGWTWWIDAFANLWATPNASIPPCPFSITETSYNFRALTATATLVDYRNKQYIVSNLTAVPGVAVQAAGGVVPGSVGYGGPTVTETYTIPQARAEALGFELGAIVTNLPILQVVGITVNGSAQPVQLGTAAYNFQKSWWYFPGYPYLYAPNVNDDSPALPYPPVTSPYPSDGDTVEITYIPIGSSQSVVLQNGNPLTPSTPGAAGTWGSGVFENVQQVKNINLQSDLTAIAEAYLNRSDFVPTQVEFETDVPGAQVGQAITINLPPSFVTTADAFIITSIQGTRSTGVLEFDSSFKWVITATTGQDIGNSIKWFERLVARTENPLPVQQFAEQTWILSPGSSVTTASAATNPVVLTSGGTLVECYAIAGTPPTNQTLVIDILDNGASILGPNTIQIPPGQLDPVYVSTFAQATVAIGDQLTVAISYLVGSGTALPAASVTVSVRWSTPGLPQGQVAPGQYAAYVAGPLAVTTITLPGGTQGVAYPSTTLAATGGVPPYSWTVGGLPPGLNANGSGVITGTPTTPGDYVVSFTAQDNSEPPLTAVGSATITVQA